MSNSFAITLGFLVLTVLVGAFIRRRARDRCLMSFSGDAVVLETTNEVISGRLVVENTGLEFVYPNVNINSNDHKEASYLLYKFEYANIRVLVRYHTREGATEHLSSNDCQAPATKDLEHAEDRQRFHARAHGGSVPNLVEKAKWRNLPAG